MVCIILQTYMNNTIIISKNKIVQVHKLFSLLSFLRFLFSYLKLMLQLVLLWGSTITN